MKIKFYKNKAGKICLGFFWHKNKDLYIHLIIKKKDNWIWGFAKDYDDCKLFGLGPLFLIVWH